MSATASYVRAEARAPWGGAPPLAHTAADFSVEVRRANAAAGGGRNVNGRDAPRAPVAAALPAAHAAPVGLAARRRAARTPYATNAVLSTLAAPWGTVPDTVEDTRRLSSAWLNPASVNPGVDEAFLDGLEHTAVRLYAGVDREATHRERVRAVPSARHAPGAIPPLELPRHREGAAGPPAAYPIKRHSFQEYLLSPHNGRHFERVAVAGGALAPRSAAARAATRAATAAGTATLEDWLGGPLADAWATHASAFADVLQPQGADVTAAVVREWAKWLREEVIGPHRQDYGRAITAAERRAHPGRFRRRNRAAAPDGLYHATPTITLDELRTQGGRSGPVIEYARDEEDYVVVRTGRPRASGKLKYSVM